jgi:hypothetical protein
MNADFYAEIQALEDTFKQGNHNVGQLSGLQSQLDGLMYRYKDEERLGADRYALYQMQAMISYRLEEYDKAKRYIDYAVKIKGGDFTFAKHLKELLGKIEFKPKSEKIWWWLIIGPWAGLLAIAVIQFLVQFLLNKSASGEAGATDMATTVVNIFSVLLGMLCVIPALLLPIWIIELVATQKRNRNNGLGSGLSKTAGVWLAVLFGFWYWAYTIKTDPGKFWGNAAGSIFTAGYWSFVAWIWAIVHAAQRPAIFYDLYPYYRPRK